MKTIGIIGKGFVGNAVTEGMKHAFKIETFDLDKNKSTVASLNELVSKTNNIFVCVPTPMCPETGKCDISIIEKVLKELNNYSGILVIIKSTLSPGSTKKFEKDFLNLEIVFNPEFLTEANAIEDFKNQNRIVLGSSSLDSIKKVKDLYNESYPNVPIFELDPTAAEMVKYTANCYLAVKVAFANEIYQICQALNINYDIMINVAQQDERLGKSHWKVPGTMPSAISGKLLPGFSGTCLVKDINGNIFLAKELNVDPKVMIAAWQKNLEVRPEYDWEYLVGRAISNKEE